MKIMAYRRVALALALLLVFSAMPALADSFVSQETAQARMLAMKDKYPEGKTWNNSNYYAWKGGIYSGGSGCAGFAFMLSDAAFGDARARMINTVDYDALKIGDILRINNDTHSVIIIDKFEDHLVLAEGNFNNSIHWGRTYTRREVETYANYYITRYPVNDPEDDPGDDPGDDPEDDPEDESTDDPFLILPDDLKVIGEEAFCGIAAEAIYVPDGVQGIDSRAFADCPALTVIRIPESIAFIEEDAFEGCDNVTVLGMAGGVAEDFANQMGFDFVEE